MKAERVCSPSTFGGSCKSQQCGVVLKHSYHCIELRVLICYSPRTYLSLQYAIHHGTILFKTHLIYFFPPCHSSQNTCEDKGIFIYSFDNSGGASITTNHVAAMHNSDSVTKIMKGISSLIVLISYLTKKFAELIHINFILIEVIAFGEDRPHYAGSLLAICFENIEFEWI